MYLTTFHFTTFGLTRDNKLTKKINYVAEKLVANGG